MKKLLLLVFVLTITFSIDGLAQSGQSAKASHYHEKFNGRKTASGDTYWDHMLTAASNIYKLGTKLLVTNVNTGKSVQVVVNDRMAPSIKGRVDLSKSAFTKIARLSSGVVPVSIKVLTEREFEAD